MPVSPSVLGPTDPDEEKKREEALNQSLRANTERAMMKRRVNRKLQTGYARRKAVVQPTPQVEETVPENPQPAPEPEPEEPVRVPIPTIRARDRGRQVVGAATDPRSRKPPNYKAHVFFAIIFAYVITGVSGNG